MWPGQAGAGRLGPPDRGHRDRKGQDTASAPELLLLAGLPIALRFLRCPQDLSTIILSPII